MLELVLILVMTGHLLAVGLAGALPLFCVWLEWRETRHHDAWAGQLGRQLARKSMGILSVGIVLGVLAILISWERSGVGYFDAYLNFRAANRTRFEFGVAELLFFYVCMAWYVRSWGRFRWRGWHRLIAILAATDLLYHFPPLFAAVAAIAARPELRGARFVHLLIDPEVLSRTVHHWLASFTAAGVFAAWQADKMGPLETGSDSRPQIKKGAARLALAAGCLQLPLGLALVMALSDIERGRLLGGSWQAASLMAAGLLMALGMLHHLAAVAVSGGQSGEVRRTVILLSLTFLAMVATRQFTKDKITPARRIAASQGSTSSSSSETSERTTAADSSADKLASSPDAPSTISSPAPMHLVTLNAPGGSSAKVHVDFGFNCYSFKPMHNGQATEVLWSAPDFESGRERASGSGNPILFPFAGRITGGKFQFEGKEFQLEPGDGRGNAIHGFVLNRPWRITAQSGSAVTAEFQASVDAPELLSKWPSDFHITSTYELAGNTLHNRFIIRNPGQGRLPFGLGTHPYFRLPLGPQGNADQCVVTVPIRESWELVELLPTGNKVRGPVHEQVAKGIPFGETRFDDVFTGVQSSGGQATAFIHDQANGRTLKVVFDDCFRECVVYNPPHRQAICIEPYTCVPDAFMLAAKGENTGLRVLTPGEVFSAEIAITLE